MRWRRRLNEREKAEINELDHKWMVNQEVNKEVTECVVSLGGKLKSELRR